MEKHIKNMEMIAYSFFITAGGWTFKSLHTFMETYFQFTLFLWSLIIVGKFSHFELR